MPKIAQLESLDQTRNLLVNNTIGKWYLTAVTILLEREIDPHLSKLGLYGFSSGRHTWEISAAIKGIAQHASIWGKDQTAHIAAADIARAFDNVTVSTLGRAMDVLAIPARLQYALIEPLSATMCTVLFEGIAMKGMPWDRSLRTGGTESPMAFNFVVLAMWTGVVAKLDASRIGYEIPDPHSPTAYHYYNHALWADNIYFVGRSAEEIQHIVDAFTEELTQWQMQWKRTPWNILCVARLVVHLFWLKSANNESRFERLRSSIFWGTLCVRSLAPTMKMLSSGSNVLEELSLRRSHTLVTVQ